MSYSEQLLKLYLGTKGIKDLCDNEIIHCRTKNKWLKSNFMNRKLVDIGFKYYPISNLSIDTLNNLILEGYE